MKKVFSCLLCIIMTLGTVFAISGCLKEQDTIPVEQNPIPLYDLSGISFNDASYIYDGYEKQVLICGELPEGVRVEYSNNELTDIGEQTATATLFDVSTSQKICELTASLKVLPLAYDKYDLNTWLQPIWQSNIVYNETIMFVGKNDFARLSRTPKRILSVTNYELNKKYAEDKDFIFDIANEGIRRTDNSDIPYFETNDYYLTEPDIYNIPITNPYGYTFNEQRYAKYAEGNYFTSRQICVTYICDDSHLKNFFEGKSDRLTKFLKKLENKTPATALFYGDSIATGCNASGSIYGGNTAPYTPMFSEIVTEYLRQKYDTQIEHINTAVGGTSVSWGINNVEASVNAYHPDLAVVAFGMNDGWSSPQTFKAQTEELVKKIHSANPDCCILLIATTVPNNETSWYQNQKDFLNVLSETEANPEFDYVTVADMTTPHVELLKRKRFRDMTGNNINHPNDFLIRVYAQVILQTMLGDDFTMLP